MGEPPAKFKAKIHALMLEEKQQAAAAKAAENAKRKADDKSHQSNKDRKEDGEEKKDDGDEGHLLRKELARSFADFTLPTKEEGFDEVRFEWAKEKACEEYLKAWVLERKLTQRVEDLQPGQWFKDQYAEWNNIVGDWRRRHSDWKD